MEYDKDLRSIQEARDLMKKAVIAQKQLAEYDQQQIDDLVRRIAEACEKESVRLAKMAHEETGFGKWQDKVLKNLLGSRIVWENIKNLKTVGILKEDKVNRTMDVAVPMGVVLGVIPSTNPTSTTMYKTLISLKAGNAIVISPHPNAAGCIIETVRIMQKTAAEAGAPENIIQVITTPTMQSTQTLMKHPDTGIILATGGEAMVRSAYSSGNPALGVGPGNGPCYIERTADIPLAVKRIHDSKTFDNGTICASEQSVIVDNCIRDKAIEEMKRQHFYFMNTEETEKVGRFIMRANNTMNPKIVGKCAQEIARMANISIPSDVEILVANDQKIGKDHPYSREKLCPILGFFTVDHWEEACELSIRLLANEGTGHTMVIHSNDESIIREFALKKPVSRFLVNTLGSLGGVGATTGLMPALTLGCGAIGGSATSDNVGPMNLLNTRHVAYGLTELADVRALAPSVDFGDPAPAAYSTKPAATSSASEITASDIERITREVLRNLQLG